MKRSLACLLLMALLLCTACSQTPDVCPPEDCVMLESTFVIADGKVTEKTMHCAAADYTKYYTYIMDQGVETLKEGKSGVSSPLTFAQLQAALDCLAAYVGRPDFDGYAGPYENGTFRPESRWYVMGDQDPGEHQWFFAYSVSKNTLTPLHGKYTGSRIHGTLSMSNLDRFGNVTDGTNQVKWCYVFFDQ